MKDSEERSKVTSRISSDSPIQRTDRRVEQIPLENCRRKADWRRSTGLAESRRGQLKTWQDAMEVMLDIRCRIRCNPKEIEREQLEQRRDGLEEKGKVRNSKRGRSRLPYVYVAVCNNRVEKNSDRFAARSDLQLFVDSWFSGALLACDDTAAVCSARYRQAEILGVK